MFLREATSRHLVEILDLHALMDPHCREVRGRYNHGEDLPEAENFTKSALMFPSGEFLPRCWCDPHYRDHELPR
ncbi:MAG: acetyltransferase [Halofilum sp. (in: g-proteobacteria)]